MQKTKYLIRLDDACPYMDSKKWQRMEDILDKYGVKPLVGIIPSNADTQTMKEKEDPNFWNKAHTWEQKGWTIALHGFDHVCISTDGMKGLNPFWKRSEFAGVALQEQKDKIRKGYDVLKSHGFVPNYFFAPSHTFDENTLKALKQETDIRIISDTIGRNPYKKGDFIFVPQISGHCSQMLMNGIYTFCFHPNVMNDKSFASLDAFLSIHHEDFWGFGDLPLSDVGGKHLFDSILSKIFFIYRRLRGLK